MDKTYQTNQNTVKGQIMCRLTINGQRVALCLPAATFWAAFLQIYPAIKGAA